MLDADRIMQRCDELARQSELPGGLTRVFLSPQYRAATDLVLGWMREAGMRAALDAIGNTVGRYDGGAGGAPCLLPRPPPPTPRRPGPHHGLPRGVPAIASVRAPPRARRPPPV